MAARMDMPAMALIDRDGVFGAPRFHLEGRSLGIRPHIGSKITTVGGHRYPLLIATRQGYRNLCRLTTRMKMRARKGEGVATLEELAEHAAGLICLTGGPDGPVGRLLQDGQNEAAEVLLRRLAAIFPGRLYVELQRHGLAAEQGSEAALLDLAYAHELPLVATNECFFADAEMN